MGLCLSASLLGFSFLGGDVSLGLRLVLLCPPFAPQLILSCDCTCCFFGLALYILDTPFIPASGPVSLFSLMLDLLFV
jgi:hypothetical protein